MWFLVFLGNPSLLGFFLHQRLSNAPTVGCHGRWWWQAVDFFFTPFVTCRAVKVVVWLKLLQKFVITLGTIFLENTLMKMEISFPALTRKTTVSKTRLSDGTELKMKRTWRSGVEIENNDWQKRISVSVPSSSCCFAKWQKWLPPHLVHSNGKEKRTDVCHIPIVIDENNVASENLPCCLLTVRVPFFQP